MKKVILYSPGISSMNIGDSIIEDGVKDNLRFLLKKSFVVEVSTHLPMSFYYMRHLKEADLKFVCGSNLLKSTFFGFKRQWDITLRLSKIIGPTILVGAGWWQYGNKMNIYTKILLKSVLSKTYIHSVRDEYTKDMLQSIGINNVINTSCATMWKLTKEHCKEIPMKKGLDVVFTLTDYYKDFDSDKKLIDTLVSNYKNVYFWPQGLGDIKYIEELNSLNNKIKILAPSLESFNEILTKGDIDYIGTRLHGGVRALQNKVRTMIIAVDNRAIEKKKDFNIPVILRSEINRIEEQFINIDFETKINIPEENIKRWKEQFRNEN